jgi:hypothetical protein
MSVNILADFKENGIDKNEPHIVLHTDNEMVAGMAVKQTLEDRGYKVESLIVVEGDWTLEQLHDMANYGADIEKVKSHILFLSEDMIRYMNELRNNPAEKKRLDEELKKKMVRK